MKYEVGDYVVVRDEVDGSIFEANVTEVTEGFSYPYTAVITKDLEGAVPAGEGSSGSFKDSEVLGYWYDFADDTDDPECRITPESFRDAVARSAELQTKLKGALLFDPPVPAVVAQPAKPPADPKAAFGASKPNLALIPGVACAHEALALEDGAMKYGPGNWRYNEVEAMTYLAAALRHLQAYIDGERLTSDTKVHNLGAVRACCGILLDAEAQGTLKDNRPKPGKTSEVQTELQQFKKDNWAGRSIDWQKGRR
jgi:hypothetical protein